MTVQGELVAGELVAGSSVTGRLLGTATGGVTTTITLMGSGWDATRRAMQQASFGDNRRGSYLVSSTQYVWASKNDGTGRFVGYDPGDWVAELSGETGIEVQLGSGLLTGSQVATAYRAATGGSGSGADVILSGVWGVGAVAADSTGGGGIYGNRNNAHATQGGVMNEILATHMTSPGNDALITAIGVWLVDADSDDDVIVGLYSGGTSGSFTGTTLLFEVSINATGTGWAWVGLTPAQVSLISASTSLWAVVGGVGSTTRPGFNGEATALDLTNQNVIQLDTSPTSPLPASLAGASAAASYAIRQMVAFEYLVEPFVSDGSWLGTVGVHSSNVITAGLESDLPGPQAPGSPGANVQMALRSPNIPNMVLASTSAEVAIGGEHTGQFRGGLRSGGAIGDPGGSTRVADLGLTSGSATDAWVGFTGGAGTSVAADTLLHLGLRSNTQNVSVCYASSASGIVDPPGFPVDFVGGNVSEYESGTSNSSYSCDQTVAIEASFSTDAGDIQPGNYPGLRLRLSVPGDTVS